MFDKKKTIDAKGSRDLSFSAQGRWNFPRNKTQTKGKKGNWHHATDSLYSS
jgi:hypothetical protein